MFNVVCSKLHDRRSLNFFTGMLLNEDPDGFVFFWGGLPGKGAQFFLGCMVVILLSFLCNYDKLTLKLHQEERSYSNEGVVSSSK